MQNNESASSQTAWRTANAHNKNGACKSASYLEKAMTGIDYPPLPKTLASGWRVLGEKAKPIDTGIKNYKVFHNVPGMSEATVQKCVVDKTRGEDGQARRATSQPRPPQVGEASDAADDVPREAPEPIHTECHVSYQKEDRAEAQMEKPGQKELRKALAPISCARLNETRVTKDNLETAGFYSSGAVVKHDTDNRRRLRSPSTRRTLRQTTGTTSTGSAPQHVLLKNGAEYLLR